MSTSTPEKEKTDSGLFPLGVNAYAFVELHNVLLVPKESLGVLSHVLKDAIPVTRRYWDARDRLVLAKAPSVLQFRPLGASDIAAVVLDTEDMIANDR